MLKVYGYGKLYLFSGMASTGVGIGGGETVPEGGMNVRLDGSIICSAADAADVVSVACR